MEAWRCCLALLFVGCAVSCLHAAYGRFKQCRNKLKWLGASAFVFFLNVVVVGLPGRLDSDPENLLNMPTLLAPAPWAFIIWAVIYLGEFIGLVRQAVSTDSCNERFAAAARAWNAANIAQILWCCTFRPWALDILWLSAMMLGTIAACLFPAQLKVRRLSNAADFWTVVFPRSLHLGWATAATLVNLNSYVGASFGPLTALVAALVSVATALVAGTLYVSCGLNAAAGAVAWALSACGTGRPAGPNVEALGPAVTSSLQWVELSAAAFLCLAILKNCCIKSPSKASVIHGKGEEEMLAHPLLRYVAA